MGVLPKILISTGAFLVALGLLLWAIPPFGKLPGDLFFEGEYTSFYFPIVSCLVLSVLITLGIYLWNYFNN